MRLSDHDLRQIDDAYLEGLSLETLQGVSKRLCHDLKEARERLNQTPENSSRPPSTRAPWTAAQSETDAEENEDPPGATEGAEDRDSEEESPKEPKVKGQTRPSGSPRKPGKQPGAPGHGRTQHVPVTGETVHRAEQCSACGQVLDEHAPFVPCTGHYVLDIEWGDEAAPGIRVTHVKHLYGDTPCGCGHQTRRLPQRAEKDVQWSVEITEWHRVGPGLMALIVCLALRMRLSRARIREFLGTWLGVTLATGTLNQCVHEAAHAVLPVEEELVDEVNRSELLHGDETSWKEAGKALWLWVFTSTTVTFYLIGYRTREFLDHLLGEAFTGWLMSDGYRVYRAYTKRLRCWAHLVRKARGLAESLVPSSQRFGQHALDVLQTLMQAVYEARESPGGDLKAKYQHQLDTFRACCERYQDADHEKTRELAREFLNDWEAIFAVLSHPQRPLTNNQAERALRHWVILRKLSLGTRSEQGSRALALLASVIDTCRQRGVSPWTYLAEVIRLRRQGLDAPPLPTAA
jgi:hypothetical protein